MGIDLHRGHLDEGQCCQTIPRAIRILSNLLLPMTEAILLSSGRAVVALMPAQLYASLTKSRKWVRTTIYGWTKLLRGWSVGWRSSCWRFLVCFAMRIRRGPL